MVSAGQPGAPAVPVVPAMPVPAVPPAVPPPVLPAAPSTTLPSAAGQPWPAAGYAAAGYPAAGYPYPASFGPRRRMGVNVMIGILIVTAIVYLLVVRDYFYWASWRLDYNDTGWATVDACFGCFYLIAAIAAFAICRGLFDLRAWAWLGANLLCIVAAGVGLVGVLMWGLTTLDIIGFCVHVGLLVYLNLNPTRVAFGYKPLF